MTAPVDPADHLPVLAEQADRLMADLRRVFARIATLRKEAAATGLTDRIREALTQAEDEVGSIQAQLDRIQAEMIAAAGIPEAYIEEIEQRRARRTSDEVDRTPRASVAGEEIKPDGTLEDLAPAALERLLGLVDPGWLRAEAVKGYRLDPAFLQQPLVLVRGSRPESEFRPIHRFAQMLLVSRDFVEGNAAYDLFGGSLLVPQLVALGRQLPDLAAVAGETQERIRALWRLGSDTADATAYELLVAASCAGLGREMEFLPAGRSGEKTPDLRVHDYPFPVVVECKRRQALTDADYREARRMKELFTRLRAECEKRGLWGVYKLRLDVDPESLPIGEVIRAALQQPYARDPREYLAYGWGKLAFHWLRERVLLQETRLYSPMFLKNAFGWDTDLPAHDGLVCQVAKPENFSVSEAWHPLALLWTNDFPAVFRRRARTASGLYGKALEQIPAGEAGVVYVCYQEGDRESVADDRTRYMTEQLSQWTHHWTVQMPISILSRIIPRPLHHGRPDLIETGIQYVSGLYGSPVWFQDFPTRVFTR